MPNSLLITILQYPIDSILVQLLYNLNIYPKTKFIQDIDEYQFGIFDQKKLVYGIHIQIRPHKIIFKFQNLIDSNIQFIYEKNKHCTAQYNNTIYYQNQNCQYKRTSRLDANYNEIQRYTTTTIADKDYFEGITIHNGTVLRTVESYHRAYYIYHLSQEEILAREKGYQILPYPVESTDEKNYHVLRKK